MKKILIFLAIIIFALTLYYLLASPNRNSNVKFQVISSFEDCVAAGYDVSDDIPSRCLTSDGRVFSAIVNNESFEDDNTLIEPEPDLDLAQSCQDAGGSWLAEFNECEHVGGMWCSNNGGIFNDCASACRNNPEAEFCTQQCVLVCSFNY